MGKNETTKYPGGYTQQELDLALETRRENLQGIAAKIKQETSEAEREKLFQKANQITREMEYYESILKGNTPKTSWASDKIKPEMRLEPQLRQVRPPEDE